MLRETCILQTCCATRLPGHGCSRGGPHVPEPAGLGGPAARALYRSCETCWSYWERRIPWRICTCTVGEEDYEAALEKAREEVNQVGEGTDGFEGPERDCGFPCVVSEGWLWISTCTETRNNIVQSLYDFPAWKAEIQPYLIKTDFIPSKNEEKYHPSFREKIYRISQSPEWLKKGTGTNPWGGGESKLLR